MNEVRMVFILNLIVMAVLELQPPERRDIGWNLILWTSFVWLVLGLIEAIRFMFNKEENAASN